MSVNIIDVFKNKIADFSKLITFGFKQKDDTFVYTCNIVDNQFNLHICVSASQKVTTTLTDNDTGDEYTLHLNNSAVGAFVGRVRSEYEAVLQTVADSCFTGCLYKTDAAQKILSYAQEKYGDLPEFLWEKFPDFAVLRRHDSKKWYALLAVIAKNKIGLNGDEKTEMVNLHAEPNEIEQLIDNKRYFSGYHMNKKHWLTIVLDDDIAMDDFLFHLNKSYELAKK